MPLIQFEKTINVVKTKCARNLHHSKIIASPQLTRVHLCSTWRELCKIVIIRKGLRRWPQATPSAQCYPTTTMIQLLAEVSIISETRAHCLSIDELLRITASSLRPIGVWAALLCLIIKIRAWKASTLQAFTQTMNKTKVLALTPMRFMMIGLWRLDNRWTIKWNSIIAQGLTLHPLKRKILGWEWMIGCRRCAPKADMSMA